MMRLLLSVMFAVTLFTNSANADILSDFDTSLENWTTNDYGLFTHQVSGGNPNGFLQLDNSETLIAQIQAPTKFLGDLSGYISGTFSFDGNMLGMGGAYFDGPNSIPVGPYLDYGFIQIIGASSSMQIDLLPDGGTAPFQSWQTYSVDLNGAQWGLSDSAFASLMADVTEINIVVEGLYGMEIEGIDNVEIVAVVPEPISSTLFIIGGAALGFRRMRKKVQ